MIEEFKKDIWNNKSEFRFMPEEIYEFHYDKLTKQNNSIKVDGIEKKLVDNLNCPKISVNTYISSKASNPLRIIPPYPRFLNLIEPALMLEIDPIKESLIVLLLMSHRFEVIKETIEKIIGSIERIRFTNDFIQKEDELQGKIEISMLRS
jgi:hypothetical protein